MKEIKEMLIIHIKENILLFGLFEEEKKYKAYEEIESEGF